VLYFRIGLSYSRAFIAGGVVIAFVAVTCLTAYISWKSLKSVDDRRFVKKLWKLNLNNYGSGKRQGHEADRSPRTSAEVKKMWFCTVTLPYVLTYFCLIGHQQLYMLG
jgi:hypothetical protein